MNYNVKPFVHIDGLMSFSIREKICLIFLLLSPFSIFIAHFSTYYISMMDVFIPFFAVLSTFFFVFRLFDRNKKKYVFPYFFIMNLVWCSPLYFHLEQPSVSLLIDLFYLSIFALLCYDARVWIYDNFIKILSILFFLGLIELFLSQMGISYISVPIERTGVQNERLFYQGMFMIFPEYWDSILFRFQSLAEEPGLIGTLCAFILATIDFHRYKIQTIVFFFTGILSMSLAFYLLMLILGISKISFRNLKLLLGIVIISFIAYYFFYDLFTQMILDRLSNGIQHGSLDNRNTQLVNKLFQQVLTSGSMMVTGVGLRTFLSMGADASAGFKKAVVEYGLLPILLAIFSTCKFFWQFNSRYKGAFVVLVMFCISLYQRFDLNLITNTIVLYTAFELQQNRKKI